MVDQSLKISGLKSFSDAAVWREHSDPNCEAAFAKKTLIYGFNGSGKTTLSRVFSSIERSTMESSLPTTASFEVVLSDSQSIRSSSLSNPFEKNLLVFNHDFIRRNMKWDESSVEPIFFLSEEDFNKTTKHKDAATTKLETGKTLDDCKKAVAAAESALKAFKTDTARRVRNIVPQMTQSFDGRKIESAYNQSKITKNDQLGDDERVRLQSVLIDNAPLPQKPELELPPQEWLENLTKVLSNLGQSPGSVIAGQLSTHPTMLQWIKNGFDYHLEHEIDDCLLCGNELTDERKAYLSKSFDSRWDEFVTGLGNMKSECITVGQNLSALRESTPSSNDIQSSERNHFAIVQQSLFSVISEWQKFMANLDDALDSKIANPSEIVDAPSFSSSKSIDVMVDELHRAVAAVNQSLAQHNKLYDEFEQRQSAAIQRLRDHVLSENRTEWRRVNDELNKAKRDLTAAEIAKTEAEEAFRALDAEIRTHGKGADQLNGLLGSYLGHQEIKLEPIEAGYKLIRADGKPAERLSEGERTALAFCHFLTQLKAEGRDIKNLVLVIDDPISSLDTSARTHAFSLMRRMTKNCAQVIVLTHNMSFMNLVKREFTNPQSSEKSGLFMLDCKSVNDDPTKRTTSLIPMPSLLADFDTEYHYLFDLVLQAAEKDQLDHYFMLPNVTRKLLESFVRFAFPDRMSFAEALMSNDAEIEGHEIKALERLVQIESHGTLEGMEELPSLTVEEAFRAAKAAMAYIRKRDKTHFDAMKRLCKKTHAAVE